MDLKTWALHETGHWFVLKSLDRPGDEVTCDECQMFVGVSDYTPHHDLGQGDREGLCGLYGSTSAGDITSFTATPHDGRVKLEWSVSSGSGSHHFRIYASEDGKPYVLIYEGYGESSEEHFSTWDDEVINGAQYIYRIWCDDGFASGAYCTPSGSNPLARYSLISCQEESDGIHVIWTTSFENGATLRGSISTGLQNGSTLMHSRR